MPDSLFGHLVFQFSAHPEDLATEALCFILNRSYAARDAFSKILRNIDIPIPANLKYETQAGSQKDTARPDLIGRDASGQTVLLGESKFWAGLTDNQPVTYLHRLSEQGGSALLFIAPSVRIPTLWPELVRRCKDAALPFEQVAWDNPLAADIRIARTIGAKYLVLASWKVVLAAMQHALELEDDRDMLSNLSQLKGLCEQMDTTAFLPVQSEELTGSIGHRVVQYAELVEDIFSALAAANLASKGGYVTGGSKGTYIRYMRFAGLGCSIEYNPFLWSAHGPTPLWLGINTAAKHPDLTVRDRLVSLEVEEPKRMFAIGNGYFYIPLFLPVGVEKPQIIEDIVRQIVGIRDLLVT